MSEKVKDPLRCGGIPSRSQVILSRELDNEMVLFDPRTNKLHSLNPTACFVWQHCDGITSVDMLATLLGRSFAVSSDQAEADLRSLLGMMHDEGLIEFS